MPGTQCAAVSTHLGAISVPEHWPELPKTNAASGQRSAGTGLPFTTGAGPSTTGSTSNDAVSAASGSVMGALTGVAASEDRNQTATNMARSLGGLGGARVSDSGAIRWPDGG